MTALTRTRTSFLPSLLLLCGCSDEAALVPPNSLPFEIETIRSNSATFQQGQDNPLASVVAGAVMDDLAGLHGCWGASDTFRLFGALSTQDFEYYRFDLKDGAFEWQVLQESEAIPTILPQIIAFVRQAGNFQVMGSRSIDVSVTNSEANDPMTGDLFSLPGFEPINLTYYVTLDGDYMKIRDAESEESGTIDERDDLVFTRFDCP